MKASTGEEITADSIPNLDDWGWDDYWSVQDWMFWYYKVKAKYGKADANYIFLSNWDKQTFGASIGDAVTFDSSFRKFLKDNGLYEGVTGGVIGTIFAPVGSAVDVVSSGSSIVSEAATGTEETIKSIKKNLPIIILVALGIAAYYFYGVAKKQNN